MAIKAKFGTCSICSSENQLLYRRNPPMCKGCYFQDKLARKKKTASKPKKKISPFSEKKLKEMAEYRKLREPFMRENPICQARFDCCTGQATDCHHVNKRGEFYLDVSTWMALCRSCHDHIHFVDPKKARELGFLK